MKKTLLLLFVVFSLSAFGQTYQYMGAPGTTVVNKGSFRVDSFLYLPNALPVSSILRSGALRYNTVDSSLAVWTGTQWLSTNLSTSVASAYVKNQYASQQVANAWFDSLKASRVHVTDRIMGSLSGQSHIYVPFTAATGRQNVGIHFHNLPLWEADDATYSSAASPYTGQNSGGTITSQRYLYEDRGDTNRLDYSQQIHAQFRYNFDTSINAYGLVGGRKEHYLHMPGFNSNNQYYNNGGHIVMRSGQFGNNGANYVGTLGMFNSGGSFTVLGDVITQYFADVDLQRVINYDKKVFNGSISQFHSEVKFAQNTYIQAQQSYARRINAVHIGAPGDINTGSFGWATHKDTILNSSQIDTLNGVYIEPLRTLLNETKNGFGIFQSGTYDVNVFAGKSYFTAGSTPNFANSDSTSARLIVKGRAWMDSTSTGVFTAQKSTVSGALSANSISSTTSVSATTTLAAGGTGTLTGGFYNYVTNGGWSSFGANSAGTKLTFGGYRASQWVGVEFYASATKMLDITTSSVAIPQGRLNLTAVAPPSSSADASGSTGDLIVGTDGNMYYKTATGWVKFAGVAF